VIARHSPWPGWGVAGGGVAVALLALGTVVAQGLGAPVHPGSSRRVLVTIPPGTGLRGVARRLAQRGLVRSAIFFEVLALVSGEGTRLEAGTYALSPGMDAARILSVLSRGQVATATVTVVPGMTVQQVARRLAALRVVGAASFMGYAHRFRPPAPFVEPPGVRDPLEGFLFPNTYRVNLGSSPLQVVAPMVQGVVQALGPQAQALARREGLTPYQVLTLASMVEREARLPWERPLVAAVFLNRLRRHMPLQSDATVYYAARVPAGQPLTAQDLRTPSPYNTYLAPGLPPGPIANPSLASIQAVLHPRSVPYLYFVILPNGRAIFSTTYQEQLQAERTYLHPQPPPSADRRNGRART
jgi:UPF0755 protein